MLRQLANIGTRNERLLTRAGQNDDANCGVVLDRRECVPQVMHGVHVQRIQHLRPVDGDVGNLVLNFKQDVSEFAHDLPPPSLALGRLRSTQPVGHTADRQLCFTSES